MSKNRILVVDDDESVRRVLQVQLEQCGYAVSSAGSPQQSMAMLTARSYDVVITDLKMPGVSGLELLKQIHALYPGP